jgi:cell filamentation protein
MGTKKSTPLWGVREGNGRIARLLATLMALQAGLPLLDFSGLEKERQMDYFAAVQNGMNRNYEPMEKIFSDIIAYSLQIYDE